MSVMHATASPSHVLQQPYLRRAFALLTIVLLAYVSWEAFKANPGGLHGPRIDKLLHFSAFLSLAISSSLALVPGWRSVGQVVAGLLLYGALIEIVQAFIPGRDASVLDLLADAAGLAAGLGLFAGLRRLPVLARLP